MQTESLPLLLRCKEPAGCAGSYQEGKAPKPGGIFRIPRHLAWIAQRRGRLLVHRGLRPGSCSPPGWAGGFVLLEQERVWPFVIPNAELGRRDGRNAVRELAVPQLSRLTSRFAVRPRWSPGGGQNTKLAPSPAGSEPGVSQRELNKIPVLASRKLELLPARAWVHLPAAPALLPSGTCGRLPGWFLLSLPHC